MICEYPLLGQPVRIDTNLSKRELEGRGANDLPEHRPTEKRNNFSGHLICWWRATENRKRIYKVDILAFDLITLRMLRHPRSDGCRNYNDACTVIREAIKSATPVKEPAR